MNFKESDCVELKREYIPEIKRSIIAFANTNGGTLYIGVEDDGEVVGVDDSNYVIQQVVNSVRDSIKPDLLMFIRCETIVKDEKEIIAVNVQEGPCKPYYMGEKGLKPTGVFIRVGTATNHATDRAIRQMIKESDGDVFEDLRSIEQNLTFKTAANIFDDYNLDFGEMQKKTLGIMTCDGVYTNLGLLISDQCPHIIRAALFNGTDMLDFQDRKDFSGSLLKQMNDAYNYVNTVNRMRATFSGLYRRDSRDFPEEALREAVINSVVHRDYTRDVPTKISKFADRVEIISYGGIPFGESIEAVKDGLSICRNPKLANIFYRLKIVEAYGTGMKKMLDGYVKARTDENIEPAFLARENMFKVTLPSIIYYEENEGQKNNLICENRAVYLSGKSRSEQIIELARLQGNTVTRCDVEKLLNVSLSTANRILKELVAAGKLKCEGSGRSTIYIPIS